MGGILREGFSGRGTSLTKLESSNVHRPQSATSPPHPALPISRPANAHGTDGRSDGSAQGAPPEAAFDGARPTAMPGVRMGTPKFAWFCLLSAVLSDAASIIVLLMAGAT